MQKCVIDLDTNAVTRGHDRLVILMDNPLDEMKYRT